MSPLIKLLASSAFIAYSDGNTATLRRLCLSCQSKQRNTYKGWNGDWRTLAKMCNSMCAAIQARKTGNINRALDHESLMGSSLAHFGL